MAIIKRLEQAYNTPEEKLLGAMLTVAVEDVYRLPKIKSNKNFERMLFDLWDFFNSDWFYEVLEILQLNPNNKEWRKARNAIIRFSRGRIKKDGTIKQGRLLS